MRRNRGRIPLRHGLDMADLYYARIELHGATGEKSYETLHDKMKALGWLRELTWEKVAYALPHATYAKFQDGTTVDAILAALATAVDALKVSPTKPATILVIKSAGSKVRGSKP